MSEEVNEGEFACPICMSDANYPVVTQCGHIYCYACLKLWLTSSRESICAVCKAPVNLTSGLTPIYAGRNEGEDPRPHDDLCKEINAAREEHNRAHNRFRRFPRINAEVNFAARNLSPLDLLFNGLLNMLRERAEQNMANDRQDNRRDDRRDDDPDGDHDIAERNRRMMGIKRILRGIFSGLLIIIWVAVQMYFNTPRIQVYRFGAGQER